MSAPSTKRQRSSTNDVANSIPAPPIAFSLISSFPKGKVLEILWAAALAHPDVADRIKNEHAEIERARVISFDYLSKSAWKTLNVEYSRLSGSHQYQKAGEAEREVARCIKTIRRGCPIEASLGTKRNGLETLRKIGKSICLSSIDVLGHEVQKSFQYNNILDKAMRKIAKSLSKEERETIAFGGSADKWIEKLEELEKLSKDRCLFEGLKEVVGIFKGKEEVGEDEGPDTSDESEDEELDADSD